ncbi:MAG: hypothetical protein JWN22_1090 [Nocardioides sp.]|nr:hypothetical protein [Nocardioides sp.]
MDNSDATGQPAGDSDSDSDTSLRCAPEEGGDTTGLVGQLSRTALHVRVTISWASRRRRPIREFTP